MDEPKDGAARPAGRPGTLPRSAILGTMLALSACGPTRPAIPIDADDIAGTVTSAAGPEAGVWVIAETADFATTFLRTVVTDDAGRFVIPDLPAASYRVWVRGYGLADSAKLPAQPGQRVHIPTTAAADAAAAAELYPAIHWYAMMKVPAASELEGRVTGGLNQYLTTMKNASCVGCHQLGNPATRTLPKALGEFASSEDAWLRRIQSGQAGPQMTRAIVGQLGMVPIRYLADWTDRIAAGELPATRPSRPQGIERNVVTTVRDWSDGRAYLHDLVSTDRRNPTVNAGGPVYGSPELSTDRFPILDPRTNSPPCSRPRFATPTRRAKRACQCSSHRPTGVTSCSGTSRANSHNPMIDHRGRVWHAARIRGGANPAFCRKGSSHPSAVLFPTETSGASSRCTSRGPAGTPSWTPVSARITCSSPRTPITPCGRAVAARWSAGLTPRCSTPPASAERAQGWTALVLDTNGNGRRDAYVEPDAPGDPRLDRRINAGFYAVMPNPVDGSVWGSVFGYPGAVVRLAPGADPPATALAEVYKVPLPGFGVRGADIDRHGVVWVSLGSGHLGEFDRRLCKARLNGPDATGDHCPEGWKFHDLPGPSFSNHPGYSVESSYYTWVDQHDTSGLGSNVPIATGNLTDGLHAWVNGRFVTLRVPYPLGFYAKGLDGRIDDPATGWKGRGLWSTSGDRTPFHHETGKGSKPLVVHFQVRPHPLAH